jgi:hypothetical protein
VKRATKDTLAGRRYLDLQREAKRAGRPTDELAIRLPDVGQAEDAGSGHVS